MNALSRFWQELKRRKVFRVIVMYAGAAYVITEVVNNVAGPLHFPDWVATLVVLVLIIGFPIVAVLSWIFDITPGGLKKTGPIGDVAADRSENQTGNRKLKASDLIIVMLTVTVCVLLFPKIFQNDDLSGYRDKEGRVRLAIMPFENLTGDSTLNYWQRGIPEILINDLGASDALLVASSLTMSEVNRSMGVSYAASLLPEVARETADKLQARIYISGNFQKSGDRLRVMVNMVNTEDKSVLWSKRVDGEPGSDYMQLSDSISNILKNYLEIESLKQKAEYDYRDAFAASSEAYRFYIEGVDLMMIEEYELAKENLLSALQMDSTFAMAYFYMAWASLYGEIQDFKQVVHWLQKAYDHKNKLPHLYQNWLGVWYSMFVSKERQQILRYCDLIAQSETRSRLILFDIGLTYKNFGFYEEAVREFEKVLAINEEWGEDWKNALFYRGSSNLRGYNAYHESGRHERENEIYEIGLKLFPGDLDILSRQAICAYSRGDTVKAGECMGKLGHLLLESGRSESDILRHTGVIFETAGLFEQARAAYEKALSVDPEDLWSSYYLIEMLILNDIDVQRAMVMNQEILDRTPDNIFAIRLKGLGYYKEDRYKEALDHLKKWEEVYAFVEGTDAIIVELEEIFAGV